MDAERGEFADLDPTPEEFRELGYRTVELLADHYESIDDLPVRPDATPAEVAAVFDEPLPEGGSDPDAVIDEWAKKVLPYAAHNTSPRFFGFVMGSGSMMGTLADAVAAGLNMNVGGWKPAPSGTEVERRTIRWLAEMVGYSAECGGLLTSGGTMANVTAVLTALRNTADYDTTAGGLQSDDRSGRYTLYMADHEGHSSIVRAADMLNLGRDAVRLVPSREDFTMDVAELERLLDEDEARGDVPFCVVGQAGSINVGAVDPLADIARVCEERGLWFHADGACGAVGAILPEKRRLYDGIERADSVTLDPHKWLYIPYECGCVLVRETEQLRRSFSMDAPYLRDTATDEYAGLSYFDAGPQMSRGFRALKVWSTLKHYGVEGYRTLLGQNVRCAEHLDGLVRDAPDFEAFHEPTLYIYSFRYAPADLQDAAADPDLRVPVDRYLDELNERIVADVQESGLAFLTTTEIRGRKALRLSICSHRTTLDDIDRVFAAFRDHGERLDAERPAELASR